MTRSFDSCPLSLVLSFHQSWSSIEEKILPYPPTLPTWGPAPLGVGKPPSVGLESRVKPMMGLDTQAPPACLAHEPRDALCVLVMK